MDVFSVAKLRVAKEATKFEKIRGTVTDVATGKATMGQLIEVYRQQSKVNDDLASATVTARMGHRPKLKCSNHNGLRESLVLA